MNYKTLTLIALVSLCLCIAVPASAMWNNGNWVPDNANDGYQVHFEPQTGVTSKYKDINPVNEIKASNEGNGGIAIGSVRAGYSTLSQTIYVRNVLQPENSSSMVITVNPDATFRIPEPDKGVLAPGNYSATLDNFNLPDETVRFTIAANQQEPTRISFLGQAVSSVPELYPMTIEAGIEGCDNLRLTGLKLVKDELITVPESTRIVCNRVMVSAAYDEVIIDTPAYDETVIDTPAHVEYRYKHHSWNSWSQWSDNEPSGYNYAVEHRHVDAVTHIVHHAAVTHTVHHNAVYETQCREVVVPSYQYWTYKLEGRVSVRSIDTEITNPNKIPVSGTATVVVGYTVDHNFGRFFNTNQDLENMRKTFTGRFENVNPGVNNYGDVPIVFSDRINDAIIDDEHFPQVVESSIVTDVPWGYHMNN